MGSNSHCPFQFSLRTLLIIVTIASCGLGWLGLKVRQAQQQREAVVAIEKLGGQVTYDYDFDSNGHQIDPPTPPRPAWLLEFFGVDMLANVTSVYGAGPSFTDAHLVHLQRFRQLETALFEGTAITDKGCQELQRALPRLLIELRPDLPYLNKEEAERLGIIIMDE